MSEIVIVDDNKESIMLMQKILERSGHDVVVLESAPEALEYGKSNVPDIIITDIVLPGMGGIELIEQLRKMSSFNKVAIIASTGYSSEKMEKEALEAGCDVFLTKPYSPAKLLELVDKLIEEKNN